jgi:hypothetical protein
MRHSVYLSLLFCLILSPAFSQKYKPTNLDVLLKEWEQTTKEYATGITATPPQGLLFEGVVVGLPQPCSIKTIQMNVNLSGLPEFLKNSPVSHCVKIKHANGKVHSAWLQDVLLPPFKEEIKVGSKISGRLVFTGIYINKSERSLNLIMNGFEKLANTSDKA